ncbi:hypothetical protein Cflav_PD2413 [Pedosphaera parvula Ellin514]|uniref:Uncharacterized protein n=2 Tax=Pedosphaera TaxID=1032526 RepID=B9XLV1_PEDPL|nr:hypothetical protein Cflav_PD2413 [Pedosphaera parvula Ellin514]
MAEDGMAKEPIPTMQLTKSTIENWLVSWDQIFPKISLVCGSSALVFVAGNLLTQGMAASRVFIWLFGAACSAVFIFAAAYAVLAGLSIYFERRWQTRLGAICGLSAGLIFGVFLAFLAFAGLVAVSIS